MAAAGVLVLVQDHPRLRGGNVADVTVWRRSVGSSPLARGKLVRGRLTPDEDGIIPACAGETRTRHRAQPPRRDHPRLRGGNDVPEDAYHSRAGSSPLARGKHGAKYPSPQAMRIIPACAGETSTMSDRAASRIGSSPLARGKLPARPRREGGAGIIPACAGETHPCHPPGGGRSDHPRLRGGNGRRRARASSVLGSSPLARGKPRPREPRHPRARIIPACAGETLVLVIGGRPVRDHPRLRGGNLTVTDTTTTGNGSSPLARGKPDGSQAGCALRRIIPACAGGTDLNLRDDLDRRDHPRLRGGNCRTAVLLAAGAGIIPACAGETLRRAPRRHRPPDHPRLRGGNTSRNVLSGTSSGSSPLARGKHLKVVGAPTAS